MDLTRLIQPPSDRPLRTWEPQSVLRCRSHGHSRPHPIQGQGGSGGGWLWSWYGVNELAVWTDLLVTHLLRRGLEWNRDVWRPGILAMVRRAVRRRNEVWSAGNNFRVALSTFRIDGLQLWLSRGSSLTRTISSLLNVGLECPRLLPTPPVLHPGELCIM